MNNVLSTIYLLHFLNDGTKTTINSLLPFIAKEIHMSYTQIGLLGAAQGLLAMVLALPIGIIATKVNGMKLILLSLFLYSLCTLGIGLSPNFPILFIFFYLAGASFTPFHIVGQSLIARSAPKEKLGSAIGTLAMFGDTGRVTLPAIALFIVTIIGWRFTYAAITIAGLILLFSLLYILRKSHEIFRNGNHFVIKENSKDWLKQLFVILRKKELLLVTMGGVIDGIGSSSIYLYLPFLLLAKGVPQSFLFLYLTIYFIGSLVGRKLLGKRVDIQGPAKIFITAEFFMALLLIIITLSTNIFAIFFISFVLGLFTRGTTPIVTTLFTAISHKAHYEKVYTISEIFLGAAAVLSPIILGKTADNFGITTAFYLAAFFAFCATIPIYLYTKNK